MWITLSCPTGVFPTISHNEVQDLQGTMLSDTYHDVEIEPHIRFSDHWFNPGWQQQCNEMSLLVLFHCLFGYVCESRLVSVNEGISVIWHGDRWQ